MNARGSKIQFWKNKRLTLYSIWINFYQTINFEFWKEYVKFGLFLKPVLKDTLPRSRGIMEIFLDGVKKFEMFWRLLISSHQTIYTNTVYFLKLKHSINGNTEASIRKKWLSTCDILNELDFVYRYHPYSWWNKISITFRNYHKLELVCKWWFISMEIIKKELRLMTVNLMAFLENKQQL